MVNRYADEAEANRLGRAEELAAEGDHAGRLSGVGSLVRRLADETRSHFSRPTESSRTSRLGAELSLVESSASQSFGRLRQRIARNTSNGVALLWGSQLILTISERRDKSYVLGNLYSGDSCKETYADANRHPVQFFLPTS